MADKESKLNLRLTAQNEGSPAFTAIEDAMKALQATSESVSSSVKAAMESMNTAASQNGTFKTGMTEDDSAIRELAKTATSSTEAISKAFQTMKTTSTESAGTAASQINKNIESLSSTSFRTRTQLEQDFEGISKSFGNASLAAVDAAQLTDSQLKKIVETAQQTNIEVVKSMDAMAVGIEKSATAASESINKGGLLIGLQQVGQSMEQLGKGGANLFEEAITSASDFEASQSRIHAVLMNREPTANMKDMAETALKLGSNSKFSANEISAGMYDLARQGLSSSQILGDGVTGAIETVNNLAQSVDGDMGETAKVVTDVLHEFNLQGKDLAHVGDLISGTMHTSSISMNDFYYAMRNIGPVASNMHQNVDDVSTSIALLAQHGVTGGAAGTALKNMFLGLEPRTAKAAELMNDLGISAKDGAAASFYELSGNLKPMPEIIGILNDKFGGLNDKQKEAALSATFTKYGLAGLNTVVMEGKDKFNELKKTLGDEKSADIAREKLNNLNGDMLRLKAAATTMGKTFGDTLQPAMRAIAEAAESVVHWFTSLSPETKKVIMIVGGIASVMAIAGGAILTVVSTIGFLSMGLGGLGITFGALMAPIAIAIGAIALIGFAVYELWKNFDTVNAWLRQHIGIDLPTMFNAVKTITVAVFKEIGAVITDVWKFIKTTTQQVWEYIEPTIVGAIKRVSAFWNSVWPEIQQIFTFVWKVIGGFLSPILIAMTLVITAALGFIKGAWHDAWNVIKDVLKFVWDIITGIISVAWDLISGIFKVALDLLTGHWGKAWNDMKEMLGNLWNDIKKLFGNFISDALNFGKDLVMGIAHGIEGAIEAVIGAAKKVVSAIMGIFSSAPKSPSVSSGDAVKQASQSVPKFASGGIVKAPTLALIGEGGEEEYVIPKSKLQGQGSYSMGLPDTMPFGGNSQNRGGKGQVVVNINANAININGVGKNGQQLGGDIMQGIRQQIGFAFQ